MDATPTDTEKIQISAVPCPEEEARWVRARAKSDRLIQRACKKCPGWCCRVFSLSFSLAKLPGKILEIQQSIRDRQAHIDCLVAMGHLYHGSARPGLHREINLIRDRIAHQEEDLEDLSLWRELLVPVKMSKKFLSNERQRPFKRRDWYYTCKAFDPIKNRCSRYYERRPHACPAFICEDARKGRVPKQKDVYAGQTEQAEQENQQRQLDQLLSKCLLCPSCSSKSICPCASKPFANPMTPKNERPNTSPSPKYPDRTAGGESRASHPSALLCMDLGADSLDQIEIIMALEEDFSIEINEQVCRDNDDMTIKQLAELVERLQSAQEAKNDKKHLTVSCPRCFCQLMPPIEDERNGERECGHCHLPIRWRQLWVCVKDEQRPEPQ